MSPEGAQSIATYDAVVALGEAMERLEQNSDFKVVFGEHFIEAFAVTNVMQIAQYDEAGRARSAEKMLARSHFMQFIEMVKNDKILAQQAIIDIRKDAELDESNSDEE